MHACEHFNPTNTRQSARPTKEGKWGVFWWEKPVFQHALPWRSFFLSSLVLCPCSLCSPPSIDAFFFFLFFCVVFFLCHTTNKTDSDPEPYTSLLHLVLLSVRSLSFVCSALMLPSFNFSQSDPMTWHGKKHVINLIGQKRKDRGWQCKVGIGEKRQTHHRLAHWLRVALFTCSLASVVVYKSVFVCASGGKRGQAGCEHSYFFFSFALKLQPGDRG